MNGQANAHERRAQVASTQVVGDAMAGWDTDWRGGLWAPASQGEDRDLPPLRLRDRGSEATADEAR